jgi:hypothetical protein
MKQLLSNETCSLIVITYAAFHDRNNRPNNRLLQYAPSKELAGINPTALQGTPM